MSQTVVADRHLALNYAEHRSVVSAQFVHMSVAMVSHLLIYFSFDRYEKLLYHVYTWLNIHRLGKRRFNKQFLLSLPSTYEPLRNNL